MEFVSDVNEGTTVGIGKREITFYTHTGNRERKQEAG